MRIFIVYYLLFNYFQTFYSLLTVIVRALCTSRAQGAQQGEMIYLLIDKGERGLPHQADYIAI